MRRRRIVHRSDANQLEIVRGLKAVGASVDVLGDPLDLLVGFGGVNYLLEVKDGPGKKLTPGQVEFFRTWRGQRARVDSLQDALSEIGVLRS